jgi:hypothetical protein
VVEDFAKGRTGGLWPDWHWSEPIQRSGLALQVSVGVGEEVVLRVVRRSRDTHRRTLKPFGLQKVAS